MHIHVRTHSFPEKNPFICLHDSLPPFLSLSSFLRFLLYCGYLAKRNRSRVSIDKPKILKFMCDIFACRAGREEGEGLGRASVGELPATYVYDYLRLCATRRCYSRASYSLYQHFVTPCECECACGVCVCVLRVDLIFFLLLVPIFYLHAIYKMKFLCKN